MATKEDLVALAEMFGLSVVEIRELVESDQRRSLVLIAREFDGHMVWIKAEKETVDPPACSVEDLERPTGLATLNVKETDRFYSSHPILGHYNKFQFLDHRKDKFNYAIDV